MQARIVRGEKAPLTGNALRLYFPSVSHPHARADSAAIALSAFQPYLQPMITGGYVVAQQRGRLIAVHDENVEIAVIVEIAEGTPPAHMWRRDRGSGLFSEFDKSPISLAAENDARVTRRKPAGVGGFQFRI